MTHLTKITNGPVRLVHLACFMGLLVLCGAAQAQNDAYSIEVAVKDRSPSEQRSAYRVAMREVLLNNSGDKTLLNRDDVRAGLQAAEQYVDSFNYRTPAPGSSISRSTPITDAVRNSGEATQFMLVSFDSVRIDELIRPKLAQSENADSSTTVAGELPNPLEDVRSSLMWLIIEDAGKQTLVGGVTGGNVMQRAREIAGGAGVSLLFPAGDQVDQQAVPAQAIQTAATDVVTAGASRYAPAVVLASYLVRNRTGGWTGQWLKIAGVAQQSTTTQSTSLDEALQQGLQWLNPNAGFVSQQNSFSSTHNVGTSAEALIWIGPLRSTNSYAQVMQLLNSVPDVDTVYAKEVLSGGMVFAITPRTAISSVSAAASTRTWLRQSATPTALRESQFANDVVLNFEYDR